MIKKFVVCFMVLMGFSFHVFAASGNDFSYQGIKLGDDYDAMVLKLGAPRSDMSRLLEDRLVTYYFYKDTRLGIDEVSKEIVDIRIADKAYTAENGIRLGATAHKIMKEYGKAVKEKVKGQVYYIYYNEDNPKEKLMLDVSPGYLEEIRITDLAD